MKRVTIMDIPFLHTDQEAFVSLLDEEIKQQEKTFVITANPEIVMIANENEAFMTCTKQATYITADGIGIVKAAQLLNNPLPGRVTGFDTMMLLLHKANENHYKIFLLGAENATLQKTIANISTTFPNINIVGSHDGYFDWENNEIAETIQDVKPDIVFVALGAPRQEMWISNNLDKFESGVFIGVGGSFDAIAGTVKRAPAIWQKLNLEWLYRIARQPSRWRRAIALPRFMWHILKLKYKGKGSAS